MNLKKFEWIVWMVRLFGLVKDGKIWKNLRRMFVKVWEWF